MDQESSDEDDVFSCGRCKQQFSHIENFMEHKKGRTCKKVKPQQESQTLPSQNLSSLSGEMMDTASAASQEMYHSRVFTEASAQEPEVEYSIQPNLARFLAVLQEGQLAGQSEMLTPGPLSEVNNGQAIVKVFEKLLESQSRDLPKDLDYDDGACLENSAQDQNPENVASNSQMSEIPFEDQTITGSHSKSLILETQAITNDGDVVQRSDERELISSSVRVDPGVAKPTNCVQRSRRSAAFKSSGQPSREPLLAMEASENEESCATNKESETIIEIPEEFQNTQPMTCKFCFESLRNAERLFAHYMDVHKIKADSAVEFLQQSPIKRKRGRPPKGQCGKKQPTIPCPHCNLTFRTRSLCSLHVKEHHYDSTETVYSKTEELPSQRRRKCSRCSFQTTASKDLTAHIHKCHGNKQSTGGECPETVVEELRDLAQEQKPQTRRGRKQKQISKGEFDDISSPNDDDSRDKTENKPRKSQVKCPECKKTLGARGLKRHQVRCTNRNRFVCPLCQHKSRESYDHSVHVDNHRTWVTAQPNWVETSQKSGSKPDEKSAVDGKMPALVSAESNSVISQQDKVDYTSTADLDELVLITQIQNEAEFIQQNEELMPAEGSGTLEADDLSTSKLDNTSEQATNVTDGGDKKLKPRDLKCKVCYTWFARTDLPKHMLQAHNMVKRFQCRKLTCKEIFAKVDDFKAHVASHSTENPFICGCRTCMNRRLITPEKMDDIRKEKMRDYYKHMTHKCTKCWVKFPNQGSLDRHLKRESHVHPCSVCGKIQVSNRQLQMHMVIHQNERAFLCEVCGQPFKTKRDLNKHTFSHTNIRPYGCSQCSKRFSFKNKLARHVLTVHSGTKPFACEWPGCDKAFSRKDKLSEHAKTHVITDPFKCQYCGKSFCRKDMLKDHEVLHTREFRYSCPICNKGFMRPKMLEQHCQDEHASIMSHITIQPTPEENSELPNPPISYLLCEPYTYANIDQLTSFQENVPETEQLMQGQRATIEALQNAAAAVMSNGQNHFQIDTTDTFPVISLST